jgi:membrane-associated phospholipid phosphatase
VLLLCGAYFLDGGRWLDRIALEGFVGLDRPIFESTAHRFSHLADPLPVALFTACLLLLALGRGRPRHAVLAAVLLVGANVTSQLLKPALAYSRAQEDAVGVNVVDAALPSGHATASMALALAAVLVAPRALRPLAAAGGAAFTLAVSFAVLVLGWHFPSDVVGGHLLATAWALVAFAGLRASAARWPEQGSMRRAAREAVGSPSPAAFRKHGLKVRATCGADGPRTATVRTTRKLAHRLGLRSRSLGRASVRCAAGKALTLRLKPNRAARKALARVRPATLKVTVALSLRDGGRVERTLRLK